MPPIVTNVWYRLMQSFCQLGAVVCFRVRCRGSAVVPETGATILLCNHQSHLDPILVGAACHRRMHFMARSSLFKFAPLGWLIGSLGAIAIDRDGSGLSGLKETLRALKHDELVMIFPEGTRSPNGELQPLKSGFCTLAKRTRTRLVPMALDGAFDAWPRWRKYPLPGRVCIEFGAAISSEEIAQLSEAELLAEVERRIRACYKLARARRLARR